MVLCAWRRAAAAAAVIAMAAFPAAAGRRDGQCGISGQIFGAGERLTAYTVELAPLNTSSAPERVTPDSAGAFQFDSVSCGQHTLRVSGPHGDVVYSELVQVADSMVQVSVKLPQTRREPLAAGPVSVAQLRHKVPPKAAKSFRKAEDLIAKGKPEDALRHLTAALTADPDYVNAHINAGACYAALKRYGDALAHLEKALALDGNSAPAHANAAHVLLYLSRFADAEAHARQALRLEPGSDRNRYLLGLALKGQRRGDEALENFLRAAHSMPAARLHAADVLARSGRTTQAARELQAYLDSGEAADRPAVVSWLARLER